MIFSALEVQSQTLYQNRRKKDDDTLPKLQCIAQIEKAFLEGFVQIVLINTLQPRLLGAIKQINGGDSQIHFDKQHVSDDSVSISIQEIRTAIQYLIEIVKLIEAKPFAMVVQAFISNTLASNFDKYLSVILHEALMELNKATETVTNKLEKYDYKRRNRENNLNIIEEMINDEEEVRSKGGRLNDHDDLKGTLENLYPERQTSSRFSIHNPHARFSIAHD